MTEELEKLKAAFRMLLKEQPEDPVTKRMRLAALKALEKHGLTVAMDEEVLLTGAQKSTDRVVHSFTVLAVQKEMLRDERAPAINMGIKCHTTPKGRTVCEVRPFRSL